jgi:mannose-6-phosphate isomerase-like protein (cupin superfamily)
MDRRQFMELSGLTVFPPDLRAEPPLQQASAPPPAGAPLIVAPDEAQVFAMAGGGEARLLATGENTGGALWVGRFREDPGFMTTLHFHHRTDEQFYILEGVLSLYVDERWRELGPGMLAVVPRGVRHAQGNRGDKPVHFVGSGSPAGFEKLFPALEALLKRGVKPGSPEFGTQFAQISKQCDLEHLGPAPRG